MINEVSNKKFLLFQVPFILQCFLKKKTLELSTEILKGQAIAI